MTQNIKPAKGLWDDQIAQEKQRKVLKTAASSLGIAIGLFFVKFLFPNDPSYAPVQSAFNGISLVLICYSAALVGVFVFKRHMLGFVHAILTWVVLPVPILMYVMDIISAVGKR